MVFENLFRIEGSGNVLSCTIKDNNAQFKHAFNLLQGFADQNVDFN